MKKLIGMVLVMMMLVGVNAFAAEKEQERFRVWWSKRNGTSGVEDTVTRDFYYVYYNKDYTEVEDVILVKQNIEGDFMVGETFIDVYGEGIGNSKYEPAEKPIQIYYH